MRRNKIKIPIHHLLDKLGLKDVELDTPEEIEAFKKRLEELSKKLKTEGK